MRQIRHITFSCMALLMISTMAMGQASENYTGGLKVKLNDDGSKYMRFITWHQMWATFSQGPDDKLQSDFLLRRSRFLMFAQISKRFLVLTHFGLNNLGPGQMGTAGPVPSASGNGSFFMHDAWVEYTVAPGKLYLGGGLHYWNGISRANSQSTLNFLTLDNALHNWATLGTSDQFARHLGFYAKGKLGKLDYRFSINEAIRNPLLGGNLSDIDRTSDTTGTVANKAVYRNPTQSGGGKVVSGYVNYEFLDQESNTLPYFVGTYLGSKKVFNIGAGFFYHHNGAFFYKDTNGNGELVSPFSFAVDAFLDMPVGTSGGAVTAYASYTKHNWGPNLTGGLDGVGTGSIIYAHAGYLIPGTKFQPYVDFSNRALDAFADFVAPTSNRIGIGANYYVEGNNAKLSLELQRSRGQGLSAAPDASSLLRFQAMIYL